jgi:arabinose-5-phosphate isomerase
MSSAPNEHPPAQAWQQRWDAVRSNTADNGAKRIIDLAHNTLDIESQAILGMKKTIGPSFVRAVRVLLQASGRVVVMGMGKSGHIGRKIASTLASTGTVAMFVHPAEASHGDLGMIKDTDVALVLSNSGESEEIIVLLPLLQRQGVPIVAITAGAQSTLAQHALAVLDCSVEQEACPLNLAPTASTAAQLAMGDALAMALLDARGFQAEDFARSHPGGALGRKLLTHLKDVMRTGQQLPAVRPEAGLTELMREMSQKGLGATAVTDKQGGILGIFTDGDLRRLVESGQDLRSISAADVMKPNPRTISVNALAAQAAQIMEEHRITSLLVVDDEKRLCGFINTNDLMRAKVI